ncbi:MAG: bifunctional helix-turn-helix transcriptional regulator/GNAT family N-acetyltransferase [Chloroflexaceae bacterium]|jgi:DNA-binding MarR family transcriptional regulator/N-acetylglutamate synthase-like GNAT family acetyltransferase|nr:bifunctional helix-turn-helix transcriptional regulator/GNAT family N-acetyltransferase [Chloroflexaceae bacterium]
MNARHAAAVRRFNRFYTKQIGVLAEGYLDSSFSLTEARVIYELAQHNTTTATALGDELGIDAGYLSRIMRTFKKQGLVDAQPSPTDGRQTLLRLTAQGQAAFAALNARSQRDFEQLLERLSLHDQRRVVEAMETIEQLLSNQPASHAPYMLRPHQPGDMGWIVHRHAVLYNQEYGWDEQFEGLVAGVVAAFVQNYDPKRERCWLAEVNGSIVGSVFLVKKSDTVAKLRLLLVEPQARGLGIGKRLVHECVRFARQTGYTSITLWTNSNLTAARTIYEAAGFQLVQSEPHYSFGHDLVGETWELAL